MNEREKLIEKIKHVQELAERGVDGERESAAAMLEKLMKKHGITEQEISQEYREIVWFGYKTPVEERLLAQVIYKVTGKIPSGCMGAKSRRKHKKLGISCNPLERLEIEFLYAFYKPALEEELKRFLTAFMHLNELFPEDESPQAPTPRTMSKAELFKISAMMMGMDRHEPPDQTKAIEGGEQQCQTE